jgi:hypothetical protein
MHLQIDIGGFMNSFFSLLIGSALLATQAVNASYIDRGLFEGLALSTGGSMTLNFKAENSKSAVLSLPELDIDGQKLKCSIPRIKGSNSQRVTLDKITIHKVKSGEITLYADKSQKKIRQINCSVRSLIETKWQKTTPVFNDGDLLVYFERTASEAEVLKTLENCPREGDSNLLEEAQGNRSTGEELEGHPLSQRCSISLSPNILNSHKHEAFIKNSRTQRELMELLTMPSQPLFQKPYSDSERSIIYNSLQSIR